VNIAETLMPKEPTNAVWLEQGYRSKLALAEQLLLSGKADEAASQTRSACQIVSGLLKRDRSNPDWRAGATRCLEMQARIARAAGLNEQALTYAQSALNMSKSVPGNASVDNAFRIAAAYRLVGDIQRDLGNAGAAQSAWAAALSQAPANTFELPSQMADHVTILERVGRTAQAQQLRSRLQALGYRKNLGE
jgi:tetratricopeptide (TPR) repeat protein